MASPIAHSLTGAAIYYLFTPGRRQNTKQLLLIVIAANLADFDLLAGLLVGDPDTFHRIISHSLSAALAVTLLAYLYCRYHYRVEARRITLMVLLALLSQLAIDWLSYDDKPPQGIAVFWPWSGEYYMSDTSLFLNVRRDNLFTQAVLMHNFKALVREILILGPPAVLIWWAMRSLPTPGSGRRR